MQINNIITTYDINRSCAPGRIVVSHDNDVNTRTIEVHFRQGVIPLAISQDCTAKAVFVERETNILINDNVDCTITDSGSVLIPVDDLHRQGRFDMDIEVTIADPDGNKIIAMPFPLWITVNASILNNAEISEESKGTVPELLKEAAEALSHDKDYDALDNRPQINGHVLTGNQTAEDLGISGGGSEIVSGVVNQNGTITFTDSDGNTFTTMGESVIGPQGPQGIQGATGPQGIQGEPGAQGAPGAKGDKGDKGDAFTYSDFTPEQLAELKGEKGDTGLTGAKGDRGEQGDPGTPGANGRDGVSVTHSWNGTTLSVTSASGTSSADLKGEKGDPGANGTNGKNGADGYSPSAVVSKSGGTATITITDKNGTTTAEVRDGSNGAPGADGYSPSASVSKSGDTATITITDKAGTTTATVSDGANGTNGRDGTDGYSPTAAISKSGDTATITITDKNGTTTASVKDGTNGVNGTNGTDGFSPSASVSKSGGTATITITDKTGTTTASVSDGTNGTNGTNGISCTHSWSGTTLTVTSASGTSSANLKGEKGDPGNNYVLTAADKTDIATEAAGMVSVPTKTSQLTNDSGFLVANDVYLKSALTQKILSITDGGTTTNYNILVVV